VTLVKAEQPLNALDPIEVHSYGSFTVCRLESEPKHYSGIVFIVPKHSTVVSALFSLNALDPSEIKFLQFICDTGTYQNA
jgi:hypothetical protein